MKTNLIAVAVAAVSLTSFAAFADDCDAPGHGAYGHANYHPAAPSAPAGQHGNYELRNTQRFVAGHYENVTVQECREKRHGWRRTPSAARW